MARHVNLLKGPIFSSLTALALPIMGSQLMQMAYNLTDMLWICQIGVGAMAAVGAVGLYMWLATGLAILARMGGQVLVAQNIGAANLDQAGRYAAGALQLGGALALGYTLILVFGSAPLVGFFKLNSPQVVADARIYLLLVAVGMPFSFLNQVLVSVITATGNSRTPFLAMACGLGANIVLDPLLIFGIHGVFRWGVAGAALATTLAQGVVFLILFIYVRRDRFFFPHVHLFQKTSAQELQDLLKISAPAAGLNVLFPIINIVLARMVAAFGDGAVAVQKVGGQIESLSWMTADGFAAATNSFVGQNYGAGDLRRAKKGFAVSFTLMSLWGILCTLLLVFAAEPIVRIFISDPAVLPMGVEYLVIVGLSELFMCWEILIEGAYAGFGHTLAPSVLSAVLTTLRIPLAALLSTTALGLSGVWWSISLTTIFKGILLLIIFLLFLRSLSKKFKNPHKI